MGTHAFFSILGHNNGIGMTSDGCQYNLENIATDFFRTARRMGLYTLIRNDIRLPGVKRAVDLVLHQLCKEDESLFIDNHGEWLANSAELHIRQDSVRFYKGNYEEHVKTIIGYHQWSGGKKYGHKKLVTAWVSQDWTDY